ncbi:MAG: NUDIX domain-containing protein [Bacillota bacterium]|nr:NUDIX domain-containing protein [Bacillota bacterium]
MQDYIKYLRSMVGKSEILSIGLQVLVINERNQILLEKRTDNGLWCAPGGSLDIGETVIEGAKREVYEETGIVLEDLTLLAINSGPKMLIVYPNGDRTFYVDLTFYSRVTGIEPKVSDSESSVIKFFSEDELPPEEEMLRGQMPMIRKFYSGDLKITVD